MSLTTIERAVGMHAGVDAESVALAVGCTIGQVYAARRRLHRCIHDGQPVRADASPSGEGAKPEQDPDFARMARTNRSVCG